MTNNILTFTLDNCLYAFKVFKVQEVLVYSAPVKVPCSSEYVEGLINSRDQGISVINLRKKFKLPVIDNDSETRIIVVEVAKPTENDPDHIVTFGAICDSVQEVLEVEEIEIEPPPKFGNNISSEFISGLVKKDDNFIIILDEEKIFSDEDLVKKDNQKN